jgi:hypothetical protein
MFALRLRASLSASPAQVASTMMIIRLRGLRRRRINAAVIGAAPTMIQSTGRCKHHIPQHNRRWHSTTVQKLQNDGKSDNNDDEGNRNCGARPVLSSPQSLLLLQSSSLIESTRRTILTPPVTTTTNTDQIYESRSEMGFDVHDGTVPTKKKKKTALLTDDFHPRQSSTSRRQCLDDGDNNNNNDELVTKMNDEETEDRLDHHYTMYHHQQQQQQQQQQDHHSRRDRKEYGSLMDPYYVPPQEGLTHLIQGGTPCDIASAGSRHRQPYRLAEYGEESVYTLILLRHGER